PTEQTLPVQPLRVWASSNSIAWAYAFAMGRDRMDGSGTNRTHAIEMCGKTEFPGSFGLLDYINGPSYVSNHDFAHAGCYVEGVQLDWGREGLIEQVINIGGSGKLITSPGNVDEGGTPVPMAGTGYFLANKTRVTLASASAEHDSSWGGSWTVQSSVGTYANTLSGGINLSEYAESFSLNYVNGYTRQRAGGTNTGAGAFGVQPRLSRNRDVVLTANLLQTSTALTKALLAATYTNNAEYTIIIEMVSDDLVTTDVYHSVGFVLPLVGIRQVPQSGGDMSDLRTESFEFFAKQEE